METRLPHVLATLIGATPAAGPAEALLRALTTHTPVGVFMSDAGGECRFVNDRWSELAGLPAEQALGDGWAGALHPGDRERVTAEWEAAAREGRDSVVSYRFQRPDGSSAWIDGYATVLREADGSLAGWVGTCLDVTAHRTAAEELRRERELFRVTFEGAPIGMVLVGLDGRVLRANRAIARMLGYEPGELVGRTRESVTHPDDRALDSVLTHELESGTIGEYRIEKRYVHKDGTVSWAAISAALIRDEAGEPVHVVAHVEDIGERKRVEEELRAQAERDPMTGLLNRLAFRRELELWRHRAARGEPASLLLIDLDRFKLINDTLGHRAGDQALTAVAGVLRRRLRGGDAVARLGGDEFAVLAQTTSGAELAEQLLAEIRACELPLGAGTHALSASAGVVAVRADVPEDALIEAADRALYRAKNSGRDRAALEELAA